MPSPTEIELLRARWVLDSRGNPTVEVDAVLVGGARGRAAVPSGASTGAHEALELRDGDDSCFFGLGVEEAVANVNGPIREALQGKDALDQVDIDYTMVNIDGTLNKSNLGSNAILGASLALAKAVAAARGIPLYRHFRELAFGPMDDEPTYPMPVPMANVFNGGKHGGGGLRFQEFMLHPVGARSYQEAVRWIAEGYQNLKRFLVTRYGPVVGNVGDEGGFSGPVDKVKDVLDALMEAIESCSYIAGDEVAIALDPASSEFYDPDVGVYKMLEKTRTSGEMVDLYKELCETYPISSIEDGLAEDDWDGFAELTYVLGDKVQIVGDDHFVTSTKRIEEGIGAGSCNALLLKVNQVGTLTEAIDAALLCYRHDYGVVVSHRSGETEDTTIADLAVGLCCGQIKTGAPARGERTAKYNRLLRIEEELESRAKFPSRDFNSAYAPYLPQGW